MENTENNQRILKKLTIELVNTYKKCSKNFTFQIQKRVLTNPSTTTNGIDNLDGNLIMSVNDVFYNKYVIQGKNNQPPPSPLSLTLFYSI